ncbi:uncharacterized protein [Nicotiana tomentosiformis]|uniref:uncharacterized protein n=1 Tax=Nicotiana tomentosiformis TaxID=4098 RepID=UPI00388C3A26
MKRASDKYAATLIVSGFTRMLKNWWDNYLTEINRNQILGATTIATIIKTESGIQVAEQEGREDASATLIYYFRWYKDMFIEKVMIREDCGSAFWKERFISGLPRLFAEKTGHRANECPVTNKKKKKVNTLELDENIKEKLFAILEQNENSTSSSSSDESYSDSDNEMINMAYSSDSSSSSQEDNCNCTGAICVCRQNFIKVLTNDSKEVLFDIINHIDDEDIKTKYLKELKNIIINQKGNHHKIEPFNMKEVMNRFSVKDDKPTIQHLQTELKSVKDEIKMVKLRLDKIEMENLTNEVLQAANKKETISEYFTDDDNSKIDKESTSGTAMAKITKGY